MANGDFGQRLQGLLANPAFNAGIGLLAASGPRPQGTANFGSRLGEAMQLLSERQRAAMQNQAMRQQLQAQNRRQRAMQQLPGLLGQQTVAQAPATQVRGPEGDPMGINVDVPGRQGLIPTVQTPGGQQELMGLLGQIAPEQVAKGLLASALPQQQEVQEFQSPIGKMLGDLELAESRGNRIGANQLRTAIEQQLGEEVDLGEVRSFRNDVIKNSEEFLVAQQGFNRVLIGAQAGTPAGDLALTFGIMKVLDPTSVVREGEQASVRNAGSIPERIRNAYNRVLTGEMLTPEQRQDFVNQARAQFDKSAEQQQRVISDARSFSERNNLPLKDVVPEFVTPAPIPAEEAQVIPAPEQEPSRTLSSPLTRQEREELQRLRNAMGFGAP